MDVQCVEEEDQRGSLVKCHIASYRTEEDDVWAAFRQGFPIEGRLIVNVNYKSSSPLILS